MENSYFIYTDQHENLEIERFHICTWEFKNNSSFVEFGGEINFESVSEKKNIKIELFIPWLDKDCATEDFYCKLKESKNSRFIFNDSVITSTSLDGGQNINGVVHQFSEREPLCILPIKFEVNLVKKILSIFVNLESFENLEVKPNIYFRFSVTPKKRLIAIRKKGITKSTILYDIKLNQRRNIPEALINEMIHKNMCKVRRCFCFNIIPNRYDLVFFDSSTLKNVRTLEYKSFKEYLNDDRLEEDDLIVIFNKKERLDSYAFFSIFSKEYIGMDQVTIALVINLISGILLFYASIIFTLKEEGRKFSLDKIPIIFWITVGLILLMIFYFVVKRQEFVIKKKGGKK